MLKAVQSFDIEVLKIHPWQVNIPNMKGCDWNEFLEDIEENGVQHLVTVSTRTGERVVVDGHQRVRAAKEVGLKQIDAIVKPFQDELAEIMFMISSNKRRQLSDAEKSDLADAYRVELEKDAIKRVGGRPKKEGHKCVPVFEDEENLPKEQKDRQESKSATLAAKEVELSREKYRKTRSIKKSGLEAVINSWREGELSTHAAYKLAVAAKEDSGLYEALSSGDISPLEASKALRTEEKAKKDKEVEIEQEEEPMNSTEQQEPQRETDKTVVQESSDNLETKENLELTQAKLEIKSLKQIISDLEQQIKELNQALEDEKHKWLEQNLQQLKEMQELRKEVNQKDEQLKLLEEEIAIDTKEMMVFNDQEFAQLVEARI